MSLSHDQAREILKKAYKNLFHKEPTDGEIDFGLATAFFETQYGLAPGQFSNWANDGKYNWGALETGIPGKERTLEAFKSAGLHPTKGIGNDAGRKVYFYLFPSHLEAATAFLMSWGKPDTLKAAATGSAFNVAKSMRNHGYYEGFWVPPGNPNKRDLKKFREAKSKQDAENKNINDYASALKSRVATINKNPHQIFNPSAPQKKKDNNMLAVNFLDLINKFLTNLFPGFSTVANKQNFIVKINADDFITKAEYARILQSVLLEELKINSSIHNLDDAHLELSCSLPFNPDENFEMLEEVCTAVSEVFEIATQPKNIKVSTLILPKRISKYPEMDITASEINRRQFKLKFAKENN